MFDVKTAPKTIFHFHHIYKASSYDSNNGVINSRCQCNSCQVKTKVLSNINFLFFTGFFFPPIYFFLWGIRIYSSLIYRSQLNEMDQININSQRKIQDFNNTFDSAIDSNNLEILAAIDGDKLAMTENDDNPFSDKYDIMLPKNIGNSISALKYNKDYDYNIHCLNNKKFNTWFNRSLIVFSCQCCLIIIIACAIEFSKMDYNNINVNNVALQ